MSTVTAPTAATAWRPITLAEARDIAHAASIATRAVDAGVVITTRYNTCGMYFDIWTIGTDGRITSERLWVDVTSRERLEAHVRGFIENHLAAFNCGTVYVPGTGWMYVNATGRHGNFETEAAARTAGLAA